MKHIKTYSLFESESNKDKKWLSVIPDEKMGIPTEDKLKKNPVVYQT